MHGWHLLDNPIKRSSLCLISRSEIPEASACDTILPSRRRYPYVLKQCARDKPCLVSETVRLCRLSETQRQHASSKRIQTACSAFAAIQVLDLLQRSIELNPGPCKQHDTADLAAIASALTSAITVAFQVSFCCLNRQPSCNLRSAASASSIKSDSLWPL